MCRNTPGRGPNYECFCKGGFTGVNCDRIPIVCEPNTCFNGGQCIDDGTGIYCDCQVGFRGVFCELPVLACDTNPCLNNGQCINNLDGTFSCDCQPGYYGLTCGMALTTSPQCPDDGATCTCPDELNGPNCEIFEEPCLEFFYGDDCDVYCEPSDDCNGHFDCDTDGSKICMNGYGGPDCKDRDFNGQFDPECPNFTPCRNGGTCSNGQCCCPSGYEGDLCENEIDECSSNPCLNGAFCLNLVNRYSCYCINGEYLIMAIVF